MGWKWLDHLLNTNNPATTANIALALCRADVKVLSNCNSIGHLCRLDIRNWALDYQTQPSNFTPPPQWADGILFPGTTANAETLCAIFLERQAANIPRQ